MSYSDNERDIKIAFEDAEFFEKACMKLERKVLALEKAARLLIVRFYVGCVVSFLFGWLLGGK